LKDGKTTKWRIENSWSETGGDKGNHIHTHTDTHTQTHWCYRQHEDRLNYHTSEDLSDQSVNQSEDIAERAQVDFIALDFAANRGPCLIDGDSGKRL